MKTSTRTKSTRRGRRAAGNSHTIGFHHGEALKHLAATYSSLMKVIPEMAQNAVDKDVLATKVEIEVDYRGLRTVTVRDNGRGTTVQKFKGALLSVAVPHRKGLDALGQFGIGLISPLGKCKKFTFTSKPRRGGDGLYRRWTFDCAKIIGTDRDPDIPLEELSAGDLGSDCWWSSEMRLEGLTKDGPMSAVVIDDLVAKITSTIGIVMRRLKTVLSIRVISEDGTMVERNDVKAPEYVGIPLPVHVVVTPSGPVTFRLYKLAKRVKHRTEVLVGKDGDDFRFPFKHVCLSGLFTETTVRHITSGLLFDGEIIASGVTLKPDRQAFVQDQALLEFGEALDKWYEEVGKQLVEEAKDDTKAVRHQQLGVRSMGVIEEMLSRPEFAHLKTEVVDKFQYGHVGDAHTDAKRLKKEPPFTGVTTGGGVGKDRDGKGDGDDKEKGAERGRKDNHSPHAVAGPVGPKRHLVRGHSTGLVFDHQVLESSRLYQFDVKRGLLVFNTRHPAWVSAEERNDQAVMRLQEYVALQVLLCYAQPETVRATLEDSIDYSATTMMVWLAAADIVRRKSSDVSLGD